MPDDPILDNQPTPDPEPTPTPEPAAAGLTREEASQMLQETLKPLYENIVQLNQRLAAPVPDQDLPDDPSDDEERFANEFYKTPQATLRKELERLAKPLIATQADLSSRLLLDQQKAKIDSKYGSGTWDEVFAPKLDPVFDHLRQVDPAQLTSRTAIENAIETVKGRNFDLLVEKAASNKKSVSDSREAERDAIRRALLAEMPNMTGGFPQDDGKPTLSEEHRQILADMKRADGRDRNADSLAVMMNPEIQTFEQYQAAKKKMNGSARKES